MSCATNLRDLTNSSVQLILGVREGHGFGFLNFPLVVVAGVDGHRLETDIISPSSDPLFAIELVWEADIKNIRRLRQANTPVKVECYSVVNFQKRDRIGYVLLSLKQAQIVPKGRKLNITESWHRLLGVRSEMKASNPEMLLTLRIEDSPGKEITNKNEVVIESQKHVTPSTQLVPVLCADDGIVQIGPKEYCNDIFNLKVNLGVSSSVKCFLPDTKELGKQFSDVDMLLDCSILGYPIQCRVNSNDLTEKDENIFKYIEFASINIRSNLKLLRTYFKENDSLNFRLCVEEKEVATASLQLTSLILTDNLIQFEKDNGARIDTKCYLRSTTGIDTSVLKPCLDVNVVMTYNIGGGCGDTKQNTVPKTKTRSQGQGDSGTTENDIIETILSPRKKKLQQSVAVVNQVSIVPPIDIDKTLDILQRPISQQNSSCKTTMKNSHVNNIYSDYKQSGVEMMHLSLEPLVDTEKPISISQQPTSRPTSPYKISMKNSQGNKTSHSIYDGSSQHGFTLHIVLHSITFKRLPPSGKFTFNMFHPFAEVVCSFHNDIFAEKVSEKIGLPLIESEFRFLASAEEINTILMSENPSIQVVDIFGKPFANAVVHAAIVLSQKNKDSAFTATLEDNTNKKNEIGLLNVTMFLKDCGIVMKQGKQISSNSPRGFDKKIAYRVVEELEDWKERQQELFKGELKRKEGRHLTMLSSEWTKRRMELEDNLNRNIEQCRALAQSLNEATDNMRERTRKNSEKERALALTEKELERKFEIKFQELKDATSRMEAEVNHKITLMKFEKTELVETVSQLEREKNRLIENIHTLEAELESSQKNGLTKEQAAGLLQEMKAKEEKLEAAVESKMFFKEQWGKAVREIHRLKKENQNVIQAHLQHEREELYKLQLSQQAREEERQMLLDKNMLRDLKNEMHDLTSGEQQHLSQQFQQQSNQLPPNTIPMPGHVTPCLDLNSEQLQRLIDQRDQLVNSGASTNREMLVALNNQIRNLLLQMST